jgi:hypothetical protein
VEWHSKGRMLKTGADYVKFTLDKVKSTSDMSQKNKVIFL